MQKLQKVIIQLEFTMECDDKFDKYFAIELAMANLHLRHNISVNTNNLKILDKKVIKSNPHFCTSMKIYENDT